MSYDKNNIFAKILRGEIPCDKVYENDHVLALKDINPQKKPPRDALALGAVRAVLTKTDVRTT